MNTKTYKNLKKSLNKKHEKIFFFFHCTKRNVFCSLVDSNTNQVIKTNCSGWVKSEGNKESRNSYRRCQIMFRDMIVWSLKNINFSGASVVIKGINFSSQKKSVLDSIKTYFRLFRLQLNSLHFKVALSHNGCRSPKMRRKKLRIKPKKLV